MGMQVRRSLQYVCLLPSRSEPSFGLHYTHKQLRQDSTKTFWTFCCSQKEVLDFKLTLSLIQRFLQQSLGSSCVLPVIIIIIPTAGLSWLWSRRPFDCPLFSAGLFLFLFWINFWWATNSHNAEPKRCNDLYRDMWGIGGHGNGLLCLLVSWIEGK